MGAKDELLHSICLSPRWGLVRALLCPHSWKLLSPASKPPHGQDCSTWGFEACTGFGLWTLKCTRAIFCHTASVLTYSTDVKRNWVMF